MSKYLTKFTEHQNYEDFVKYNDTEDLFTI